MHSLDEEVLTAHPVLFGKYLDFALPTFLKPHFDALHESYWQVQVQQDYCSMDERSRCILRFKDYSESVPLSFSGILVSGCQVRDGCVDRLKFDFS